MATMDWTYIKKSLIVLELSNQLKPIWKGKIKKIKTKRSKDKRKQS